MMLARAGAQQARRPAAAAARSVATQAATPRVPMIRFRYGKGREAVASSSHSHSQQQQQQANNTRNVPGMGVVRELKFAADALPPSFGRLAHLSGDDAVAVQLGVPVAATAAVKTAPAAATLGKPNTVEAARADFLATPPNYGRLPPLTAEEQMLLESGGATALDKPAASGGGKKSKA